jgi:hypothetical protein
MATDTHTIDLPGDVEHALGAVRRRLRAYVWLEGLSLLIIALGAAFWVGLYLDWRFEPSPDTRRAALVAVALVALYVIHRYLVRRAFTPISDEAAAMLLERRFAQLGDHLLTAVHLANSPARAAAYHPDFVARTRSAAGRAVAGVRPGGVFDRRPLARAVVGAAAVCLSIALFAALAGGSFAVWLDRIALRPEPWPQHLQLEVAGFPRDEQGRRVQRLAAEDDLELFVRARMAALDSSEATGIRPPDVIEIKYRLADGGSGSDAMTRVGEALAGRDDFQLYRYEFKRVTADMAFDVVGREERAQGFWRALGGRLAAVFVRPHVMVRDLRLEVVARPELSSIELACEYPAYLRREPRRFAVTGGMRIPEGSRLALVASSTKPLTAARIRTSQTAQDVGIEFDRPPNDFHWDYGYLNSDDVILISVTDADGVTNREPYRVSLAAVPDEVPQVVVRLAGIGAAITPDARIPLAGKVTDEYSLGELWYEYFVDGQPAARRPFEAQPTGQLSVNEFDAFDARAIDETSGQRLLALAPGQRLALSLKATDQFDLATASTAAAAKLRAGSSQQFLLDVVSVSQFLALLERRELELRQRFEAIYEKVSDTRNLLGRIDFAEADGFDAAIANSADTPADSHAGAAQRALVRRRLRVAGSLQNVTQAADEILGVAEAFDDVHDQLTNNRIDNPDLKSRLREQIALPLRHIGEIRMPELAAQVQLVERRIEDAAAGQPELARAVTLADEVLVEMRHILDRMLELETYNEVVALLRAIIGDQGEISRQTKELQRRRLRELIEDE